MNACRCDLHGASPVRMTWARVVAAEPRLGRLLREAREVEGSHPRFCANALWYGHARRGFKDRLLALVGWERPGRHPFLNGDLAYRAAYEALYAALPRCQNCLCIRVGARS